MVIATGYFDGVHLGHEFLIRTLVDAARSREDESMVITFHPHPRAVLQKEASNFRLLSSRDEKKALLKSLGVNHVEEIEFTKAFAGLTAAQYLDFLASRYGCKAIVLGYDNRFGCDGLDSCEIAAIASSKGIDVIHPAAVTASVIAGASSHIIARASSHVIARSKATWQSPEISSTKIRKALESGDCAPAMTMLGRPYSIHGVVVSGNRLGRTIGYPTANVRSCDPLKIIPAGGVYLSKVKCLGSEYFGMTNIGRRPTVTSSDEVVIETNIFDFGEDIYSLEITVEFLERIRDEVRFSSLDELKAQLAEDKRLCLAKKVDYLK